MGAMECNRTGCESVMCDTYVKDVGYICTGCQTEFQRMIELKGGDTKFTRHEIKMELEAFIHTDKAKSAEDFHEKVTVRSFFSEN